LLTDNIEKWLAKHGYPLEMRTARTFAAAGFDVSQSEYYRDSGSADFRELDMIATHNVETKRVCYCTQVLIECKFCDDKPWLIFTEREDAGGGRKLMANPGNALGDEMTGRFTFHPIVGRLPLFCENSTIGYAVVESMREKANDKDNSYNTLMALGKAMNAYTKEPRYVHSAGRHICEVYMAVAVISGRCFQAFLGDSGGVQLREIKSGAVWWNNRVSGQRSIIVHVVTENGLPEFCRTLKASSDQLWAAVDKDGCVRKKVGPVPSGFPALDGTSPKHKGTDPTA